VREEQVAVPDDGDVHGRDNFADGVPVRRRTVAGVPRAPVNEDRACAAIHGSLGHLDVVAVHVVPAEADLDGDRYVAESALHGLHDPTNPARLSGGRGANALAREKVDRAAQVDVNEVCAPLLHEGGRPGHLFWVRPGKLDAEARFVRRAPYQGVLAAPALLQPPRQRHLAHGDSGAHLNGKPAVGKVRALGHRPHHQGPGHVTQERHDSMLSRNRPMAFPALGLKG